MSRMKKRIAVMLSLCIFSVNIFANGINVYATGTAQTGELTEEEKQKKEYEELLKKTYELPVQTNELAKWPQTVGTYGNSAIVMDADSGAVLYAKNIEQREYPASITKILTALLVFEYDAMDLYVEITEECQECLRAGYAHIGSDVGDILTMEQAMHAMLLASSNDIAYAIGDAVAKSLGKDYDWFLKRMNEKTKELGGLNSNFLNTNGVFDEEHYTCAYDMALIGRALCEYPEFFEICQTPQYVIKESKTTEEHVFQQKHEMLLQTDNEYYEYAIGGKTGYTTEAQNTLVTMADNGEKTLVCVLLYTHPGYVYSDTKALLDYGFQQFKSLPIQGHLVPDIYELPNDATIMLPDGITLEEVELKVGENKMNRGTTVSYYYEGNQVGLYQLSTIYKTTKVEVVDISDEIEETTFWTEENKKMILAGAGIFLLLLIYIKIKINQRRKRRKQKREQLRRKKEISRKQAAYKSQRNERGKHYE